MFKTNILQKYNRRKFVFVNYCKKYKLEDVLEEESFNKRFNDYKLRWVFGRKGNKTAKFLKALEQHIIDNSMIIIVIYGTPNSGKSEGAQTIALYWKSKFYMIRKDKIKLYIATSTADMSKILIKMKKGDIAIRDESPKLSGMGSVNVQKYLDNITKIIRAEQNSFIFIDPIKIEADVVHFYLESAGKNKKNRTTRFILYDKNHKILGRIYLPLHSNKILREKYKKKKIRNIQSLKANAGMVTPEVDAERLKRDIEILLKECLKNGVTTKGEIQGLIPLYNANKKHSEDMIKGDTNYMRILISNIYRLIKSGGYDQYTNPNNEIKQKEIKYKDGQSFSKFCKFNISEDRLSRVAEGLTRGDSYRTINNNNEDIPYYYIQESAKLLRSVNNEYNLGFMFEKWYALSIGVPKEKLPFLLGGASDKPDLPWENKIYSLKFRLNKKSSSIIFRQSIDLRPEYEEAKRRGMTYFLVFMNPSWGLNIQIIEIDPIKDPEEIKVYKHKPMKKIEF